MVLFQVPAGHQNSGIEMGMILTCWRGVKAPKIFSGPVNVNACVAFRAVALEVSSEDRLIIGWGWMGQVDHRMFSAKAALVYACICNLFFSKFSAFSIVFCHLKSMQDNKVWCCSSTSTAWVVRLESLIAVLDIAECALQEFFTDQACSICSVSLVTMVFL